MGECGFLTREQVAQRWGCTVEVVGGLERAGVIAPTRFHRYRKFLRGYALNQIREAERLGLVKEAVGQGQQKAGPAGNRAP
jgi:hypothetical protein